MARKIRKCTSLLRPQNEFWLGVYFLIFCFAGGQLLANPTDSSDFQPESECILFVNADELRYQNALGQLAVLAEAREALRGKDPLRYREVNHKYRAARRLSRKYERLARITELKIQDLSRTDPALFQYLNGISTEHGQKVYAYIGSKDRFSTTESTGKTFISYRKRKSDTAPVLTLSEESESGILLLHPQENAVKITLATDGDIIDTRHEMGHFEVAVTSSEVYFQYLSRLSAREIAHHDGHALDDLSGHRALHFEP